MPFWWAYLYQSSWQMTTFVRHLQRVWRLLAHRLGIELIGGDTTSSPIFNDFSNGTWICAHGQAITRQGACVGDGGVSGTVGLASLALHGILDDLHGDGHANRPPKSLPEKLRQAMQYPAPQVALGRQLIGFANSMIDISDGLGQDLGHI